MSLPNVVMHTKWARFWPSFSIGKIVQLDNGDLLGTMHGNLRGDNNWYRTMVLRSTDGGNNWQFHCSVAFSSDENALTSRSIGALSQPGGPLWNIGNSNRANGIIEFPGGMPLYRDGKLIGAIGVSGDGVEQDENVAEAGALGFEPINAIRIDTVTKGGVAYTDQPSGK